MSEELSKEVLIYDIETVDPSGTRGGPFFWYAVVSDLEGNSTRHRHLNTLTDQLFASVKDDTVRFIFAHNGLAYDMANISAWLKMDDPEWNINAGKTYRGDKRIHRFGDHKWEIYARSILASGKPASPVVALDSRSSLPGALKLWGEAVGLSKGETPIIEVDREPTEDEWVYCETDVEILRRALIQTGAHEMMTAGRITTSSQAKLSIDECLGKKRTPAYKRERMAVVRPDSLPPKVYAAAQEVVARYCARCVSEHPYLPAVAQRTERSAVKKLVHGLYYDAMSQRARYIAERRSKNPERPLPATLQKEWEGIKAPAREDVAFNENVCIFDHPEGPREVSESRRELITRLNRMIRPALRGGISRVFNDQAGVLQPAGIINSDRYKALNRPSVATGVVIDVRSMYPSVLLDYPIYSRYESMTSDGQAPLDPAQRGDTQWVGRVKRLRAHVKPGHHATIKRPESAGDRTYEDVLDWHDGWLTSLDWERVIPADYVVDEVVWDRVIYYAPDEDLTRATREHIAYWQEVKNNAVKNSAAYIQAKLMLNAIWGRWAMTTKVVVQEGQRVDIGQQDAPLAGAIFTTAFARAKLADAIRVFADYVVYTDTDSLHLMGISGEEVSAQIDTSQRFGAWEVEDVVATARYLKPKTYCIEVVKEGLDQQERIKLKTAGATFKGEKPTPEQFVYGYTGKALNSRKLADGRVVIYEMSKTIEAPKEMSVSR